MTERVPRPVVENCPGLTWRKWRRAGWEGRWRPRADLVERGYLPTPISLWAGTVLTDADHAYLSHRCNELQDDMLSWGHRDAVTVAVFDGTLRTLIACYLHDKDSPFHKVRYGTRRSYRRQFDRIIEKHGDTDLETIKARTLLGWHQEWGSAGRVSMGHSFVAKLRIIINFGATYIEDEQCERLAGVLHRMKFPMGKARQDFLTAEMVVAIRAACHEKGYHSIALAQAIQFELMLRQKDVIGEWVPLAEPGLSKDTHGQQKWLRGITWSEIDRNLILRHVTSKRQKEVEADIKLAPMVLEELRLINGDLPSSGPVIINETNGRPYSAETFRYRWRKMATAAGVPKSIRNMDSRAGAITEASDAGAPLEHIRHAATHSDISMTQRYSRGGNEKTASVMKLRTEHRNKPTTR